MLEGEQCDHQLLQFPDYSQNDQQTSYQVYLAPPSYNSYIIVLMSHQSDVLILYTYYNECAKHHNVFVYMYLNTLNQQAKFGKLMLFYKYKIYISCFFEELSNKVVS